MSAPRASRRLAWAAAAVLAAAPVAGAQPTPPAQAAPAAQAAQAIGPAVGDPAPPFSLEGSDGKVHRLSDHLGIRPVVIAWFPRVLATL